MTKKQIIKIVISVLIAALTALGASELPDRGSVCQGAYV